MNWTDLFKTSLIAFRGNDIVPVTPWRHKDAARDNARKIRREREEVRKLRKPRAPRNKTARAPTSAQQPRVPLTPGSRRPQLTPRPRVESVAAESEAGNVGTRVGDSDAGDGDGGVFTADRAVEDAFSAFGRILENLDAEQQMDFMEQLPRHVSFEHGLLLKQALGLGREDALREELRHARSESARLGDRS